MFYKNWPYWLRVAVILGGVAFLLSFLFWMSPLNDLIEIIFWPFFAIPYILSLFTGIGHQNIMTGKRDVLANLSFSLITFIMYFLIGAIIGLIYGKIKSKK